MGRMFQDDEDERRFLIGYLCGRLAREGVNAQVQSESTIRIVFPDDQVEMTVEVLAPA